MKYKVTKYQFVTKYFKIDSKVTEWFHRYQFETNRIGIKTTTIIGCKSGIEIPF